MLRLDDPAVRALAADLLAAVGPRQPPCPRACVPLPGKSASNGMLVVLAERERQARLGDLKEALDETDQLTDPDAYRAIELEYRRLLTSGRTRRN